MRIIHFYDILSRQPCKINWFFFGLVQNFIIPVFASLFFLLHSYCVSFDWWIFQHLICYSNNKISHNAYTRIYRRKPEKNAWFLFLSFYFHMICNKYFSLLIFFLLTFFSVSFDLFTVFRRRSFAVYYFIHFTSVLYWIIWLLRYTVNVCDFYGSMVLIQYDTCACIGVCAFAIWIQA